MAGLKNPDFITPDELADRWGISTTTLTNWRSQKTGPDYVKLGRRIFYRLPDIEAFEERSRVKN